MKPMPNFATLLQRFFTERLAQQQASPHTICAYRDTFRLLLKFAGKRMRKSPDRIAFEDIGAPLISAFLDDMQHSRGITARSRNARLAAIRSFFNFASYEMPAQSAQIQRVLAIPMGFLTIACSKPSGYAELTTAPVTLASIPLACWREASE